MLMIWTILQWGFWGEAQAGWSLSDAFREAKVRSEDLSSQVEVVNQAEEKYSQAIGAVLPNVNFYGTYLRQEASTTSAVFPTEQRTYKINLTQPLFRGFREYAALKQQSILARAAKWNQSQALTQLFMDTTTAYYQVLALQRDLQNLDLEIEVNQKRLNELDHFRRIGRSRASESLAVQSNIAALLAQRESVNSSLTNAKGIFRFITGGPTETELQDQDVFPNQLPDSEVFTKNLKNRPDYQAAMESALASDESVKIARGGHFPSLDFGANYYFSRPGVVQNVKWDWSLGLVFPIFQGGIVNSQVSVAASQRKQAELALSKIERQAYEQIASSYETAKGDLAQLAKLKDAVELSKKNYEAELKDYQLGLVNHLEVLQALTSAQETRRQWDRNDFQFKIDYLRLLAMSATEPRILKGVQ
jgi:outer membrane protein